MDILSILYVGLGFLGVGLTSYFSIRRIRNNDLYHLDASITKLRIEMHSRCDRIEDKVGAHVRDYHLAK